MIGKVWKEIRKAFDLLPKSYNLIKRNLQLFAILNTIPFVLVVLSAVNGQTEPVKNADGSYTIDWAAALGVSAGIAAIFIVISVVLQIMSLRLTLDVSTGKKSSLGRLWNFAKEYFMRLVGMAVIATVVAIGLVLLIMGIPTALFGALGVPALGLIVGAMALMVVMVILTARYFLAPYVMIDYDLGIVDSFNKSKEMSAGHGLQVVSVIVVSVILSIVPTLLGRVGSIIAALLGIAYSVAPALRYLEIKKAKNRG